MMFTHFYQVVQLIPFINTKRKERILICSILVRIPFILFRLEDLVI